MFQYRVSFLFSFLLKSSKAIESEIINTAYLRKKELSLLNSMLFTHKDQQNYKEICVMIQEALPPVQSITKFTDLKDYSRISYKLDLKKDNEIVKQLLTLILQDQYGNFVLKDKLIHHIIDSVKLSSLDEKITQLLKQLQLKTSEVQLKYINSYIDSLQKRTKQQIIQIQIPEKWNSQLEDLEAKEMTPENRHKLLIFLIQSSVKNTQKIILKHFRDPRFDEIILLLPHYSEMQHQLKQLLIDNINHHIKNCKITTPQECASILSDVNAMISKAPEFFKRNKCNFTNVFQQIKISNLLESQLNQLLYIITYTQSINYFQTQEPAIVSYIMSKPGINMNQMVAYFFHLTQIYRLMDNQNTELFEYCCQYFSQNISKCDSNQLFLIVKSLRLVTTNETMDSLSKIIDIKIESGAFDKNDDALINFVANKIKTTQVLFMPQTAYKVNVTDKNFGEWCHLLQQIGSIRDLEQSVKEKFIKLHLKYRRSLRNNQLWYYFVAQYFCGIHDENYFLEKLHATRPFIVIRLLHFIAQSQSSKYHQLISAIQIHLQKNQSYLTEEFNRLDKGLLSFSLFSASLLDDQSFYNYLYNHYGNEISQFVSDSIHNNEELQRKKQFNKSSVNTTTNQSLFQFYQALKNHQCLTNNVSPYLGQLAEIVKKMSNTAQTMPSQLEEKVESILKQNKIDYIKDYCDILPYRLDFLLPNKRTGIECNGCSHYIQEILRKSDAIKYKYFKEHENIDVKIVKYHSVDVQAIMEQYLKN